MRAHDECQSTNKVMKPICNNVLDGSSEDTQTYTINDAIYNLRCSHYIYTLLLCYTDGPFVRCAEPAVVAGVVIIVDVLSHLYTIGSRQVSRINACNAHCTAETNIDTLLWLLLLLQLSL